MARPDCPGCGGTGWKTVEDRSSSGRARVAVRCDCSLADRTTQALTRARIPARYQHCDFENFDTGLYDGDPQASAWNRSLDQAKLILDSFARDFPVGTSAGLLLMGPCGAGKTHLVISVLKLLVLRGHAGLFYDYRELLKHIQDSYNPVNQATELEVLEPVLEAELLVLDDLGSSKPSPWALETVGHILNTRYNKSRITLVTTNYLDTPPSTPEPLRAPSRQTVPREDSLTDRVGQRIRSRLYEMCRTVELVAPDYRKEVRQAGRVGLR